MRLKQVNVDKRSLDLPGLSGKGMEEDFPWMWEKVQKSLDCIKEDSISPCFTKTIYLLFPTAMSQPAFSWQWRNVVWGSFRETPRLLIELSERTVKNLSIRGLAGIIAHELAHLENYCVMGQMWPSGSRDPTLHWLVDKRAGELVDQNSVIVFLKWIITDIEQLSIDYPLLWNFGKAREELIERVSRAEKGWADEYQNGQRVGEGQERLRM